MPGLAVTTAPVVELNPVPGFQVYVAPPLAVNVVPLPPVHIVGLLDATLILNDAATVTVTDTGAAGQPAAEVPFTV